MTDEERTKIENALNRIVKAYREAWVPLDAEDDRGTRPAPSSEKALRAALEKARLIIAIYTFTHAKWFYEGIEHDPRGSHALLVEIDALLAREAPKEESK